MTTTTPSRYTSILILCVLFFALSFVGCAKKTKNAMDPARADIPSNTTGASQATGSNQLIGQSDAPFDEDAFAPEAVEQELSIDDPFEGWNRFWFSFNDHFYTAVTPLAKGYAYVVPSFMRTGIKNVYNNLLFPMRFLNCLLQLNFTKASREFGRFFINSTFGIGGLVDLAKTDPNLYPQNEDFGQTLAHWGVGHGFYMVTPFLGPSSARDGFGMLIDLGTSPTTYIFEPWYLGYILKAGDRFNMMPDLIDDYQELKKNAIEPYVAFRDFYVQYRDKLVKE